ncbi:hypothetical protein [Primorskyibacter flagellatus]|uniref:DUF1488 family protein n=1 Tax=Primorskyibacter flagellatus TaxID=1387277 RepID=A0A1W1Z2X3_9RHOB|nr:hypothetical protein [Primorskyibacter flagellatus]SMC42810.1 hypothetical protein SAMN06295998_101186 [Primorskyibacter flagellatus]
MTRVEVQGRDIANDAYRIVTTVAGTPVRALVPECLMQGVRPGDRASHQEAYEWIAAHRPQLIRAVAALTRGETPKRPHDILTLSEDAPASSWQKYSGGVGAGPHAPTPAADAPSKRT